MKHSEQLAVAAARYRRARRDVDTAQKTFEQRVALCNEARVNLETVALREPVEEDPAILALIERYDAQPRFDPSTLPDRRDPWSGRHA